MCVCVSETFKSWFWFSLTGLFQEDVLIASPRGNCVNPWEKMTSNRSRARDYGGCCGAWSTAAENWMDRKEPSSGVSEQALKILWRGTKKKKRKKIQPGYELTITRHGKASPLPNQPDCCINFNQTNMSKLRVESSFPTAAGLPNSDSSNSTTSVKSWSVPDIIFFTAIPVKLKFSYFTWSSISAFMTLFTGMKMKDFIVSSNKTQVWDLTF